MPIKTLTFFGDSLTAGTSYATSMYQNSAGSWFELTREYINNTGLMGPLISSGMIPTYTDFWSKSGSWTALTTSNAYNKMPYSAGYVGSGQTNTWTFTLDNFVRTNIGFAVYYTDHSSGGNWQYRVDGGSWTNMGQTLQSDNKLCKFYINTPVTSSIEFRGYNGSSDCGLIINGVELYYLSPTTTNGFIMHNLGHGGDTLHNTIPVGSADQLAIVDNVRLGTGSPNSPYPTECVIVMHLNDVWIVNNTTTWNNDLNSFYTRCVTKTPVGYMNPWECGSFFGSSSKQASYRTTTKSNASSNNVLVLDHYDRWQMVNILTTADGLAAGLLGDGTHPLSAGHLNIYWYIAWWLMINYLNISPVRLNTTAIAKKSGSPTFTASSNALAVRAIMPPGIR